MKIILKKIFERAMLHLLILLHYLGRRKLPWQSLSSVPEETYGKDISKTLAAEVADFLKRSFKMKNWLELHNL